MLEDQNIDADTLKSIMDANLATLNQKIPAYSSVRGYEVQFTPFAKTPKGSIQRFMYM
jgi:long-chain acyl-CoA synthetase